MESWGWEDLLKGADGGFQYILAYGEVEFGNLVERIKYAKSDRQSVKLAHLESLSLWLYLFFCCSYCDAVILEPLSTDIEAINP